MRSGSLGESIVVIAPFGSRPRSQLIGRSSRLIGLEAGRLYFATNHFQALSAETKARELLSCWFGKTTDDRLYLVFTAPFETECKPFEYETERISITRLNVLTLHKHSPLFNPGTIAASKLTRSYRNPSLSQKSGRSPRLAVASMPNRTVGRTGAMS